MAFPILPLLLLGVGVLALRHKGRTKRPKREEPKPTPIQAYVWVPPEPHREPPRSGGEPGRPCEASDGEGAWDRDGTCKTFWIDGQTDEAIRQLARQEWEARGRPTFSELCLAVPDPAAGEFAAPQDNPRLVEIVVAALRRYYGVGPVFPPTEGTQGNEPTSPYWVHKAWAKALALVRRELCEA